MKSTVLVLLSILSLAALAGPEQHLQNQSCYVPSLQNPKIPVSLPTEICLEKISVDLNKQQASVLSHFQPELFINLNLRANSENTRDNYNFVIDSQLKPFVRNSDGEIDYVILTIFGKTEADGSIDVTKINMVVTRYLKRNGHKPSARPFIYTLR